MVAGFKKCCVCEEFKPATLEYFHKRHTSNDGFRCDCKQCRKEKKKRNKDYNRPTKKCSCCDKEKPNNEDHFHIRNNGVRARTRSLCKECHKKYYKNHHLEKRYNLSLSEVEELKKEQDHKCVICNRSDVRLVVDHDHATGDVRELLCDNCNQGLGSFKDNITFLENAINYIKKWTK